MSPEEYRRHLAEIDPEYGNSSAAGRQRSTQRSKQLSGR
jgi:hypothetical protein